MKIFDRAQKTLSDVSTASESVVETTGWATVALIAVAAVSVLALALALHAVDNLPQRP